MTQDQARDAIVRHAQFCELWLHVEADALEHPDLFLSRAANAAGCAERHAAHAFYFAQVLA